MAACSCDLGDVEELLNSLESNCASLDAELRAAEAAAASADSEHAVAEAGLAAAEGRITKLRDESRSAQEQVKGITKAQLNEVKVLRSSPPAVVRRSLELVWLILHCRQWASGEGALQGLDLSKKWSNIQRMLVGEAFIHTVADFDPVELESAPWVVDFAAAHYLQLELPGACSRAGSRAASPLLDAAGGPSPPRASPPSPKPLGAARASASGATSPALRRGAARATTGSLGSPSSLRSAGLAAVGGQRQSQVVAHGLLDIDTVEHASKACGVLVRWCQRVVQEFAALRALRRDRAEASARAAVAGSAAAARREELSSCEGRLKAARAERDAVRGRLAELRREAEEAEKALRDLAKLRRVQELYSEERRAPEPRRAEEPPAAQVAELFRQAKEAIAAKAAAPPPPQPPAKTPEPAAVAPAVVPEEEPPLPAEAEIVIDLAPPPPLPAVSADAAGVGGTPAEGAPWWVECGYNESELCQRSSVFFRDQQRACAALARHLNANPHVVVFLEGRTSGADEDADIAPRRAEGLARRLRQQAVSESQLRLTMPSRPLAAARKPEDLGEAAAQDCEEEEEEEEEEEDEEEAALPFPARSVTARPLREVRVARGPRQGDAAQSEEPGFFFAPEDTSLESLGEASCRILARVAEEVQRLLAKDPERLLVVEGHSDEGIEDEELLEWLGQQRADAARSFLLESTAQPEAAEEGAPPREEPREAAAAEGGGGGAAAEEQEEGAEAAGDTEAEQELAPLRPEDVVACSRGRRCRATVEWGRRGLNRRVQIFIV